MHFCLAITASTSQQSSSSWGSCALPPSSLCACWNTAATCRAQTARLFHSQCLCGSRRDFPLEREVQMYQVHDLTDGNAWTGSPAILAGPRVGCRTLRGLSGLAQTNSTRVQHKQRYTAPLPSPACPAGQQQAPKQCAKGTVAMWLTKKTGHAA